MLLGILLKLNVNEGSAKGKWREGIKQNGLSKKERAFTMLWPNANNIIFGQPLTVQVHQNQLFARKKYLYLTQA